MSLSNASRKVAIAVDLSDESAFAVKWAVTNYLRPDDAVILLHVQPTSVLYGADWGALEPQEVNGVKIKQQTAANFDELTSNKTAELGKPITDAGIPYKMHIVKDHDMKERICLEVERLAVHVVIMGSRGFGSNTKPDADQKSRLGSVSDYCVHHCDCPVVVVRSPSLEEQKKQGETKKAIVVENVPKKEEEEEEEGPKGQ